MSRSRKSGLASFFQHPAKAKAARGSQLNLFRRAVRENTERLNRALDDVTVLQEDLRIIIEDKNVDALWHMGSRIDEAVSICGDLRLPAKPKNLGAFEDRYREYRDRYVAMSAKVDEVRSIWNEQAERLNAKPNVEVARSHFSRNLSAVSSQLVRWKRTIDELLRGEITRVDKQIESDHKEFYKRVAPLLEDVELERISLSAALEEMDAERERLSRLFSDQYSPYARAITQLSQGIDLDSAFAYSGAREITLERRLEQIQSLAQVGISVEILGHELQALDRRLSSSLAALPADVQRNEAFLRADAARRELVERLRFLSQMQVAGGDVRQKITGEEIERYIGEFFGAKFADRGVELIATDGFRRAAFYEFPSRIFPVFINLINNSLYWVSGRSEKQILLSAGDGTLMVSDTGPGIDPDDLPNLFELFFTRRARGRGVGLYLCQQTLAAGGHTIKYVVRTR